MENIGGTLCVETPKTSTVRWLKVLRHEAAANINTRQLVETRFSGGERDWRKIWLRNLCYTSGPQIGSSFHKDKKCWYKTFLKIK